MRTLNFTEFLEFVLVRLYDLDRDVRPGASFDVREIGAELRQDVPHAWAPDAARELESQGLARALFSGGGGVHASLTGAGRVFVEGRERVTDSVAHEYRERPGTIVIISGDGNQVAAGTHGSVVRTLETPSEQLLEALDGLARRISTDESIEATEREAYLADVASARRQIDRPAPNRRAAAAILEPLSQVAAIAAPVIELTKMMGGG